MVTIKLLDSIKVMIPGKGNLIRKPKGWVGEIEDDQYNKISCYCELIEDPIIKPKVITKPITPTKSNNNKGKKVK